MARSLILGILAYGRATLAWLASSVVAACLVNVFILLAVVAASMGNLSRPGFFEPIVAIMVGGLVSLPVALFVLVREVRK